MTASDVSGPVILLGVTSDQSLLLLRGFPDYLQRQGWDVHVVSSRGPLLEALEASGSVTCHSLKMARDPSPLADLGSLYAWLKLIRRVRPDVVSVGTPKAALLGSVAAWACRVPRRIYLVRGLRLETVTGPAKHVLAALERITCATSTDVVAVSSSLRDLLVDNELVSQNKVVVVGDGSSNGVLIPRIDQLEDPNLPRRPVVGFVGRANPDKGIDLLADAIVELAKRGLRGELLLVGDDQDGSRSQHVETIRSAGWVVSSPGQVEDVSPHYDAMRVLCLPTKREGFPNVVLEAAARRVPCVATAATGIVDAIDDGVTGIIVHERTPTALADALQVVLTDEGTARRMGAAARERATSRFLQSDVWDRYECYYRYADARKAP